MVAAGDTRSYAARLGIQPGTVVQEIGWDSDTDDDIRLSVEQAAGSELLDEDAEEVVDLVLLWWRADDGDLVDALVDALSLLADDGVVWVLTPKTGNSGHIPPGDIAEAVPTSGLAQTSAVTLGAWTGIKLVQPKTDRGKR